jgi:CDP-L-myo-inositol myo-inositolphosphotransferase
MSLPAVILAGGKGERIASYSKGVPKPLLRVEGLSLIEHVILRMVSVGIKDFIVVVGYKGNVVKSFLESLKLDVSLKIVENKDYHRGNGSTLYKALEALPQGSFVLSMSDHVFNSKIVEMLIQSKEPRAIAVDGNLSGSWVEESTKVLADEKMFVLDIGKKIEKWNYVDTGLFVLDEKIFEAVEEALKESEEVTLSYCVKKMIAKGNNLKAIDVTGYTWVDVDTPNDVKRLVKVIGEV